ncbi:helix-turn-helix domain-containing protein [Melissococcus plutonius]|uniref:Transcriptional regulator, ArsR family n=2 Tax=Melissococcus plutonius TaxID=33970 RepID=F3Y8Z3_MELPT|nr:ArsR family transcriptional regulator [Melissococcus plutonius]BAL62624.1 ArsR family transcriptional regulator [Melissococcus plutonius DAT561]AIM24585.1 ArsR family transcriptional regulator [Melissococcus plutonius S1]KMT24667.1 ArsR family transcriptional regulator [Melissococcus plutonius]KMT27380.1 ArsR family transcriptional regulator [Melissococcus plutonius]KMT27553.1 ArsR family transcriptional regulator [Melissococcus plutonius]
MQIEINNESLVVFEALASNVRIQIIQLLAKNKLNVKEIAQALNLSSAIITMHIRKLEEAKIIKTEKIGQKKISRLQVDKIQINFPEKIFNAFDVKETSIPIGHYTNYRVEPTCGLATSTDFIGLVDEPKYFMDPNRMDARIIWFAKGFVEYQSPNFLLQDEKLEMIEISMEISSEFPFANDNWPSDITFTLNGIELGSWTSPGDFADIRGRYTPDWYPDNVNQYGLLKTLRIMNHGTYIDGAPLSSIKISDISSHEDIWNLKIQVKETAEHVGGCTLFGRGFGNYDQDIKIKLFYS